MICFTLLINTDLCPTATELIILPVHNRRFSHRWFVVFMSKRELHVGVIGLGGRGHSLLRDIMCGRDGVHIEAVCDLYTDRVDQGVASVKEINGNTPLGFTDYKELLKLPNIDTVVITAAWEAHIPVVLQVSYAIYQPSK